MKLSSWLTGDTPLRTADGTAGRSGPATLVEVRPITTLAYGDTMIGQAFSGRLSRRSFTLGLATPLALALIGLPLRQAEAARRERSLLFHHNHTGETLKTDYFA